MQKFHCFEIVYVSIIFLSLFCLYLVVQISILQL